MGVKFDSCQEGYALRDLWLDHQHDEECDLGNYDSVAALFTMTTLSRCQGNLTPSLLTEAGAGGLILCMDGECGWVDTFNTPESLRKAWEKLRRRSHTWKDEWIAALVDSSLQLIGVARWALDHGADPAVKAIVARARSLHRGRKHLSDARQLQSLRRHLSAAVHAWPQFDEDRDVSGADLVEWFALWRRHAVELFDGAELRADSSRDLAAGRATGSQASDYRVSYSIDVDASTPQEAAEFTMQVLQDPDTQSWVFEVQDRHEAKARPVIIDLSVPLD